MGTKPVGANHWENYWENYWAVEKPVGKVGKRLGKIGKTIGKPWGNNGKTKVAKHGKTIGFCGTFRLRGAAEARSIHSGLEATKVRHPKVFGLTRED